MTELSNEELTTQIAYEIIQEISPRELPFFDDIKAKFLKDPEAFSAKAPPNKEKLTGFGIPEGVIQFFTVFVLPVVFEAIKKFAAKREKSIDKEQLKKIRTEAYDNAIAMGMKKEKADLMADALLGKLINL